jgi:hypothetical protein
MTVIINGTTGVTFPDGTTQADGLTTPVPVADGGTGLTSVGTAGNVLTSDGSAWVSQAISAGGNYISRIYTSPATWTKPAGLKAVNITVLAGGGGGGGVNTVPTPGDYKLGGSGGLARLPSLFNYVSAPAIPGPVAVTIGAGGTAGANTGGNGGTGGTSSFGSFLSATGGTGGAGNTVVNTSGNPGAIGGATTGPALGVLQYGNSINYGTPGSPRENATPAVKNGVGYGAGGAAGVSAPSNPTATGADTGGAGAGGIIIIEEFY